MGRSTLTLTPDQIIQMEALSVYLSLDQISDYFGICRKTLGRMRKDDESIDTLYKKGKSKGIAKVAQSIVNSAIKGNTSAQIFYLKTQAGWRETEESKQDRTNYTIQIVKPDASTPTD